MPAAVPARENSEDPRVLRARPSRQPARAVWRRGAPVLAAVALLAASGCSGGKGDNDQQSVFKVEPGQCFTTPSKVAAELSNVNRVSCSKDHTQEAYAVVEFRPSADAVASGAPSTASAFPGGDALAKFAKGACAQRFRSYVGVDYLDSTLYFTYLLPSARSWEQEDDRTVLCFVTTTGQKLRGSVKNSKK